MDVTKQNLANIATPMRVVQPEELLRVRGLGPCEACGRLTSWGYYMAPKEKHAADGTSVVCRPEFVYCCHSTDHKEASK